MKGCRSPTVVIALAVALALAMPTVLGARTRRHAPPRIRALTGISEQGAGFMSDPLFKAIDITHVRLMVPWDAGLQTGYWDAWLQTAHAAGYDVLIALEHDARSQCPDQPCHAPSPSVYARALRALLKRYPWIRELQPWNEPNHQSQPTFRAPRLAAAYYNAARRVCPRCLLVAGGMLDDPFLRSYVTRYVEALRSKPSVWGLNDYYDATYFQTDGMDTMLALTRGSLWLTETGGLVAHLLLPYDPQRAAASIRWLYTSAAKRPRIGRIYMYQWRSVPGVDFDAGLLNADGSPRPSYRVIAAAVGPRRRSGRAVGENEVAPLLRLSGHDPVSFARGRALLVRLACVSASVAAPCSGSVRVSAAGRLITAPARVRAAATGRVTLRLSSGVAAVLRRERRPRVRLSICTRGRCGPATVARVSRG